VAHLSPQARRTRTFALLRQLFLDASQRQPLVLAVENGHWLDATSEAWLTTLVEGLLRAPILLLVMYRPGYRPPWLEQSVATEVALPRLMPQDSLAVVQSVAQVAPLPDALAQAIVARADGNPFFLEELTWAVVESGQRLADRPIPETIQAVLAARIDRLPPVEKRLVQAAAVIGPHVPVPLLHAITEMAEEDLVGSLRHLQAAEFLYKTRLTPELTYTFKHVLTQEVATTPWCWGGGYYMNASRRPSRGCVPIGCQSTTTPWPIIIVAVVISPGQSTTCTVLDSRR
jgi:predicted ATPase